MSVVHRPRQSPWPAITMDQAWQIVDEQVGAKLDHFRSIQVENVRGTGLLGKVLAEPIHCARPVPPFQASIKDGYALIASDGRGPRRVVASSTAAKGKDYFQKSTTLGPGECVRVTTGARVPEGADAVVPVEHTRVLEHDDVEELVVDIGVIPVAGQDIREPGSDIAQGQLLLGKGMTLGPAELGLLALGDKDQVSVFQSARVAVLSTGDELTDSLGVDESGEEEGVLDTNRPMLIALLRATMGVAEPIDCGIVGDSEQQLAQAIRSALNQADILLVSGGVSMGEKDLLKAVLQQQFRFQIHFGRVLMKPGLPTTLASGIGPDGRPKLAFCLPGNPVSAFVTAHLFVLPQLRRVAGQDGDWHCPRLSVRLASPISTLDSRPEYRRAVLLRPRAAAQCITPTGSNAAGAVLHVPLADCVPGSQISSRLLSTRSANLLLELPAATGSCGGLEEGQLVTALVIGPI